MRGWALLACTLVAGCNQVWGLGETASIPDAAVPDTDHDGIPDTTDNCREIANSDQADEDSDAVGDLCDNCPIIVNANQDNADGDGAGDACDPHLTRAGDCLILFDSFNAPATFAAHWSGELAKYAPDIGHVTITSGTSTAMVARGNDGEILVGVFNPQMRGHANVMFDDGFGVGIGLSNPFVGYRCVISSTPQLQAYVTNGSTSEGALAPLGGPPANDSLIVRMWVEDPNATNDKIDCHIDYGSVGVDATVTPTSTTKPPYAGGTGVVGFKSPFVVDGVALYNYQPGVSCPTPIMR